MQSVTKSNVPVVHNTSKAKTKLHSLLIWASWSNHWFSQFQRNRELSELIVPEDQNAEHCVYRDPAAPTLILRSLGFGIAVLLLFI